MIRTTSWGSSADASDLASESKANSRPPEHHTTKPAQVKGMMAKIATVKELKERSQLVVFV